jgi:hypothetical protein
MMKNQIYPPYHTLISVYFLSYKWKDIQGGEILKDLVAKRWRNYPVGKTILPVKTPQEPCVQVPQKFLTYTICR